MSQEKLFYIYLIILFITTGVSLTKWSKFGKSIQVISILLLSAFFTEIIGIILASYNLPKSPVYHVYSTVEIFLTSLFFIRTVYRRKLKFLVGLIAVISVFLTMLNLIFQKITDFNSNMLVFESFIIIMMSLYSLYKMLVNDHLDDVIRYPNFWIWTLFLLYWTGSLFYFFLIHQTVITNSKYYFLFSYWQILINIILYLGIGVALILCPKITD